MKKAIFLLIFVLSAAATMAQSTARTFVLNNSADGQSTLTVFIPKADLATGRAIVACPGGGYEHLAFEHEGTDWAEFFNEQGIAYAVLKYRMPKGNRDIPMADATNAIRTMRDSASVWHVNPADVGIMGFSAGGHLASTVATQAEFEVRPNFSILFYPVISMDEGDTHRGSVKQFLGEGYNDKDLINQYSNDRQVRKHLTPPTVIFTTNDDLTVNPVTNGVAYYSAMRKAGNAAAMYIYPTGGHGFGYRPAFAYHYQMLTDLTTWLKNLKMPGEHAVRVACIGNSITDGSGIDMQDMFGYPAQLQNMLGENYNVKNFGVGARTLLNKGNFPYMKELAWRDALAFNPNIVIIKLGTNDSKPVNWKYGSEFEHDLMQMIGSLKALPAKPKIYLATPIKAFTSLSGISDSTIVKSIIPIINKVAKREKLQVIDLHTQFEQLNNVMNSNIMSPDGIHPNAHGAKIIADIIADVVDVSAVIK